jgi:hypothetical protein
MQPSHLVGEPSILYCGTPVVLISTVNEDGSPNIAPMSSAWSLGRPTARAEAHLKSEQWAKRPQSGKKVDFEAKVLAVMKAAEKSGLLGEEKERIGGRTNPALITQAERRTGIKTDTDLIEFALANVALDDNFAEAFKRSRGRVDPDLKLGF